MALVEKEGVGVVALVEKVSLRVDCEVSALPAALDVGLSALY